jgi:hypothetical protein
MKAPLILVALAVLLVSCDNASDHEPDSLLRPATPSTYAAASASMGGYTWRTTADGCMQYAANSSISNGVLAYEAATRLTTPPGAGPDGLSSCAQYNRVQTWLVVHFPAVLNEIYTVRGLSDMSYAEITGTASYHGTQCYFSLHYYYTYNTQLVPRKLELLPLGCFYAP